MPGSPRLPVLALAVLGVVASLLAPPAPVSALAGEDPGASVVLRTYRLALLSDPSYAAAVAPGAATEAQSDSQVLAAKQALVDRLNQVYGAELAIRFTLAPGTVDLNLRTAAEATLANGPCGTQPCFSTELLAEGCSDALMQRTRSVLGQLVGAGGYEIGHLVLGATWPGTSYPSSAGTEYRAYGCSGSSAPTGDAFAIGRLAHELGHQLGAGATFDGFACPEERNVDTAVEPGSGRSLMGAAGTCGTDDLQAQPEPWFTSTSLEEIGWYVTGQGLVPEDAVAAEVQSVAFTGFDGLDAFRLAFGGTQTATIIRGVNYTQDGIKAAVLAAMPSAIISKVRPYWQIGTFDDRGFEMTFASYTDIVEPTVVPVAGTFTAQVNDIDAGGLQLPGGTATAGGNKNPTVTAPADRTIPARTPFVLTGSATDPDADALTYQWQQADTGGSDGLVLRDAAKTDGPLFETLAPATSTTRSFPDLAQVVAGGTNAATGTCPAGDVDCWSEWLPTASYVPATMTFRLLARDQKPAGGTAYDDVVLTVDKTTGPFRVTSQDTASTHSIGELVPVTWTANTTALAANVKISLSTDGGLTFPTVLAASTPNDGAHTVTMPSVGTDAGRLRVEAVGNYFYDVSDADLTISDPSPPTLTVTGVPASATTQWSDPLTFGFTASSTVTPLDDITATMSGLPWGLTLTKTAPGAWSVTGAVDDDIGTYPLSLVVDDEGDSVFLTRTLTVTRESMTVVYDGDTSASALDGPVGVRLSATVTAEADGHPGDINDDEVVFTDAVTGAQLCSVAIDDSGSQFCHYPVDGSRTMQVVASVGPRYVGMTASPTTVVVTGAAPTPPSTSITTAPPTWVLGSSTSVSFSSSETGSTFDCTLDGKAVPCSGTSVMLSGLAAGSHRFTVAARDTAGTPDATPATAVFTVPVDDRALTVGAGKWRRKSAAAAYRGTYSTTTVKRAELRYRVSKARSLALVVGTASGQGRVKVFLDGTLLRTVSLSGPSSWRKLVPLATFSSPRSGVVRIVTRSAEQVRIDGLGVSTL